ncbi:SHOCT domain-containing protein, partial [Sphaerisporangium sp. B11E5]|uniref:SHOCT domain-containing protein n=1 Tax=Sphaerisporangium sp. B11E5 TaxID=3153563 RepID=UPI00325D6D4A
GWTVLHPRRGRPRPAARRSAAPLGVPATPAAPGDDPDALLRRLRELGELHREGVLTEEEFTTAKQALLRRL